MQRNPDGTFPKGVSGNPKGPPKGTRLTKAGKMSRLVDAVLGIPVEDLIQREDGRTNFTRLKDELQKAYDEDGLAYMMKLWLPIAQLMGRTNIQIEIPQRQPLRITLTNGNGKLGGNGDGKEIIDVKPAEQISEGGNDEGH